MPLFDLAAIKAKIEQVNLNIKAALSFNSHKIDNSVKAKIGSVTHNEQKNNNLFLFGDQNGDTLKKLSEGFGIELPAASEATGNAELPEAPDDTPAKKLLVATCDEHKQNSAFLLDRGRLLYFYSERENLELTKEELVFLLRSSLKADFPFWYWCIYYREKYNHVSPLLKNTYDIDDPKIKNGVVYVARKFTETEDDIFELMSTEKDSQVLGNTVFNLFKDGKTDYAQRILNNSLSRKVTPETTIEQVRQMNLPLGPTEKNYLKEIAKTGWPSEVSNALNLLSVTASEEDLDAVETVLKNIRGRNTLESALMCISKIGKTNEEAFILKLFSDTRQEDVFMETLRAMGNINSHEARDKLYKLYKDPWGISRRLQNLDEWEYPRILEKSLLKYLDEDFYEIIVQDILSNEHWGSNWHLYSWRQTSLLRETVSDKVKNLIKNETRITGLSNWNDLIEYHTRIVDVEELSEPDSLRAIISVDDYRKSIFAARKLWKVIPAQEVIKEKEKTETLRKDLLSRIAEILKDDTLPDITKELLTGGLDSMLGENKFGNETKRSYDKHKKESGSEDKKIKTLLEDVDKYDIIEREFVVALATDKSPDSQKYLLELIGRPQEAIYQNIKKELVPDDLLDETVAKLEEVSKDNNFSLASEAILALLELGKTDRNTLHLRTLEKYVDVVPKLKKSIHTDEDDWYIHELQYAACVNILCKIGHPADLDLIRESVEKDPTLYRIFWRYQNFWSVTTIKMLLDERDKTTHPDELESIKATLESLDHDWTESILGVD